MNHTNHTKHTKPPILLLLGPTATGKTDLALEFARLIPKQEGLLFKKAEIISVDSAMVYRGMDIGTGKPTASELNEIPHHLIDIRDPSVPYSAAEFSRDAIQCIQVIQSKNHIPLLVGGSMLYFRALLQGLSPLPQASPSIRAAILEEAEKIGWKALHDRLSILDPESARLIHPNDPQRIARALEIYQETGQSRSTLWALSASGSEFASSHFAASASHSAVASLLELSKQSSIFVFILLPKDRVLLHKRIHQRFHLMLQRGFIDEVQVLYERVQKNELQLSLPALRAVGYRQALDFFTGAYGYDEMVNRAIAATRQLAKRQITWIRGLTNPLNPEASLSSSKSLNSANSSNQKYPWHIHCLDLENNHLDSLKSMIHCLL